MKLRRLSVILFMSGQLAAVHAQNSRGLLLVLNKDDAALAFVDPATHGVLGTVPTGEGPHEIAVSADGRLAFVSNYGGQTPGQTLSVIDIGARKELHRVDLGPLRRPHGLSAVGGKVYFTAEVNRLVARYDPGANLVDWMLGTGQGATHMVIVRSDEKTMFTANISSDSVTIIERGNNGAWNETVVPVGKGPEGIDVSPDGREVWTAHSRDGGVSIIDVLAKKVVGTIDLGTRRSNRLKFTPDGKIVLVSDDEAGELLVVDVAARKAIKHIPLGRNPEGILIQPDGSHAFVAVNGDNAIAIVDLKTFQESGRITPGHGPDGMAWVGVR